jgi:multiple sugar transport system permease protein
MLSSATKARPAEDLRPSQTRGRARSGGRRRQAWTALAMLAPALVTIALFRLWPAVQAIATSVTGGPNGTSPTLRAYERLFTDPTFLGAVKTTLLFSVVVNPLQVLLALALAVLLVERVPAVGLWRTLVFVPVALPQAVSAIIFGVAYRPDGPLNAVLASMGLPAQPFLTSSSQALWAVVVLLSWIGVGYWMLFLVNGLQDIPRSVYEASAVDGANWWQTFFWVTVPMLRRPLLFVLVADTVANFLVFAPVQILTAGGPRGSTNLIMYDIYERAYVTRDLPAASAETFILLVIVVVVVALQFRLLPRSED